MKMFKSELKIIKAVYFDPQLGPDRGIDVTEETSSEVVNNQLVYNGIYNRIFSDRFKTVKKKLRIELDYRGKRYTKFYNEDEKIKLPDDLGKSVEKWWEKTWFHAISITSAIIGIIYFFIWLFSNRS